MSQLQRITPFLWFNSEAEQAVKFYTSVFKNSRVLTTTRYTEAGKDTHKRQPGSVMTIEFEIEGQTFTALNGGPEFKFTEAVSFAIKCHTQEEIDHYWDRLTPGGDPKAQVCGWLKDRYGLSWQVVPDVLTDLLKDSDTDAAARTMEALLKMKKLDITELKRAHAGKAVPVRA
jgi:predicted 3-demethylubiquinone-9 3-methyltransferase (glyoxalase superfamily)